MAFLRKRATCKPTAQPLAVIPIGSVDDFIGCLVGIDAGEDGGFERCVIVEGKACFTFGWKWGSGVHRSELEISAERRAEGGEFGGSRWLAGEALDGALRGLLCGLVADVGVLPRLVFAIDAKLIMKTSR